MRMFGAFLESWFVRLLIKRQIPKLNTVIRLIRNSKAFVLQKLRISKKWLLLCSAQYAEPLLSLFITVFNAGSKQIRGISMSFERPGHP